MGQFHVSENHGEEQRSMPYIHVMPSKWLCNLMVAKDWRAQMQKRKAVGRVAVCQGMFTQRSEQ